MRGGERGQASGGDFQVNDGRLEVAGFYQAGSDFVVGPGGIGLKFHGFAEMLGRLGVLRFLGECNAERVLREVKAGIGGDKGRESGNGEIRLRLIASRGCDHFVGDRDFVFGIGPRNYYGRT